MHISVCVYRAASGRAKLGDPPINCRMVVFCHLHQGVTAPTCYKSHKIAPPILVPIWLQMEPFLGPGPSRRKEGVTLPPATLLTVAYIDCKQEFTRMHNTCTNFHGFLQLIFFPKLTGFFLLRTCLAEDIRKQLRCCHQHICPF